MKLIIHFSWQVFARFLRVLGSYNIVDTITLNVVRIQLNFQNNSGSIYIYIYIYIYSQNGSINSIYLKNILVHMLMQDKTGAVS
jgi:hypothetical protein